MGIFDNGDIDPFTGGLLGATQAYAQTLGPSRLPINPMQGVLGAMGGFGQGYEGTQLSNAKYKLFSQEAQKNELSNQMILQRQNLINKLFPGLLSPSPDQASSLGLLGSPSGGPAPSGGPSMLGQPQGAPGPSGGAGVPGMPDQGVMGSAMLNDVLFPGAGKGIIEKQYPGPTDAARALQAAEIDPNSAQGQQMLRLAAQKAAGINPVENVREGGSLVGMGPDGRPTLLYQAPKMEPGMLFNPGGNGQGPSASMVPGFLPGMAQVEGVKQGAVQNRELNVADAANRREFGDFGVSARGGAGAGASAGQPQQGRGVTEPVPTLNGTMIPPVNQQAPINRAGAYLKEAMPEWAKTETEWSKALPALSQAEVQLNAIADALKKTEPGKFAVEKASIKAGLHSVGVDLPDGVWGDPAQVEIALKNNAISTLNTLKGTTSRFTQMEFDRISKSLAGPSLQPEAARSILAETLGQVQSGKAMAQDWAQAKALGWQNPVDFQRAWSAQNPLQGFVDKASDKIGALKGARDAPRVLQFDAQGNPR